MLEFAPLKVQQMIKAEQKNDGLDELFDNDSIKAMTREEYTELKRLAELGKIVEQAPILILNEAGASVHFIWMYDKATVVVDSVLYPRQQFSAETIGEAWQKAKAAQR